MINFCDLIGLRNQCVKCPYSELFWSAFFRIGTEYGETPYSVPMRENAGKMRTRITPNTDTFYALNLINVPTRYKNFDNPTSIYLILTNHLCYFQRSTVFETGLSDFHLFTITELKTSF